MSERIEYDSGYFDSYKALTSKLDLIIWVVRADYHACNVAKKAYSEILKPNLKNCPIVFVINHIDKLDSLNFWKICQNEFSSQKQKKIDLKIDEISRVFNVSKDIIETVSTTNKYDLVKLLNKLIAVLPKEKKYSVLREAYDNVKSISAQKAAEQGIEDALIEYAGDTWDRTKEIAKRKRLLKMLLLKQKNCI